MGESMPSSKKDINQQLRDTIYKKVTKKTHNHGSPKKNGDGTIKKCIELFKKEANPNVLIELEKSLKEQEESYNYYTKNFLPVLETGVMELEVKLPVFNNKIEQSQRSPTRRGEILEIISGIIKRSSNKYSKIEEQPINSIKEEIPVSSTGMTENNVESPMTQDQTQQELESLTKEEVCVSESDSGINSPGLASSSRRSSISSTLSSTEEDSNPQKEETGNKVLLEQTAEEEPAQVSSQCLTLGSREKESMDPNSQTTQMTGSQVKDSMQSKEKEEKAVLSKQEASNNENNSEVKQPNNRNLRGALIAGCALSTIGCIVAGAMTSGLVGAGLLAMAAVFAMAAVAELHSNFLSSKLTSINVSPLVDDKELTACSQR